MASTILALETATDVCSVALLQGDAVTVSLTLNRPRAHAENLVLLIQDALRYAQVTANDLDAIAVSQGPGSYTGLRIGVSTAKGLAAATDTPLIGVPSLEALAASVAPLAAPDDLVIAAFHARRNEVYGAAYRVTDNGTLVTHAETTAQTLPQILDWLTPPEAPTFWLAGNGASHLVPILSDLPDATVHVLPPTTHSPSAAWVARLALPHLQAGNVEDLASFEPFYLKAFVAKMQKRSIFERLPF